jgi:hypothetical protein
MKNNFREIVPKFYYKNKLEYLKNKNKKRIEGVAISSLKLEGVVGHPLEA